MRLLLSLLYAAANAALAAGNNLVFHEDFEPASTQSPPPGWAMWGAAQHKVPANYTRDTTNPHSGRACFRIHHPSKTGGYVVLAPDRALRPKSGMIYTASFWARTDQAGKAMFSWTAYQTINPFVDAGSPGSLILDAGSEWKEFTFSVREGLDLFADQSRFLLLTFKAATESNEERTLWIDDVRVVEQPDPTPARLLNEATLPHDTLQHRLRPGATLDFTVDASQSTSSSPTVRGRARYRAMFICETSAPRKQPASCSRAAISTPNRCWSASKTPCRISPSCWRPRTPRVSSRRTPWCS